VVAAYPSASARNARDFLRTPFEVKAIQVDGGRTGFAGETAYQDLGAALLTAAEGGRRVERAH
jgi:hypothetical protein